MPEDGTPTEGLKERRISAIRMDYDEQEREPFAHAEYLELDPVHLLAIIYENGSDGDFLEKHRIIFCFKPDTDTILDRRLFEDTSIRALAKVNQAAAQFESARSKLLNCESGMEAAKINLAAARVALDEAVINKADPSSDLLFVQTIELAALKAKLERTERAATIQAAELSRLRMQEVKRRQRLEEDRKMREQQEQMIFNCVPENRPMPEPHGMGFS
jgi:hypothetical protein